MSHSTTATSTYPLVKYSKSYPNALQKTSESTPEWQHFTNPSIRLVLDVRKGAQLESVRLRILWSMDSDNDPAQREVVFEDIDLLAFSSLPHRPAQMQQAHGLPLKAVYRDTVVGIRYLHPIEYKDIPVYRRFQITFLSSVSVLEFIKTISSVCPCKANPPLNPGPRAMNPPLAPQQHQVLVHAPSIPSQLTSYGATVLPGQTNSHQVSLASSPNLPIPQASIAVPSHAEINQSQLSLGQKSTGNRIHELQTSLSSSSPPDSSARSGNDNTNGLHSSAHVSGDARTDLPSSLLASLKEPTCLYDLPRTQLEQLVGEVVREEGFANLMEDLSSMWAVKSFVGV